MGVGWEEGLDSMGQGRGWRQLASIFMGRHLIPESLLSDGDRLQALTSRCVSLPPSFVCLLLGSAERIGMKHTGGQEYLESAKGWPVGLMWLEDPTCFLIAQ